MTGSFSRRRPRARTTVLLAVVLLAVLVVPGGWTGAAEALASRTVSISPSRTSAPTSAVVTFSGKVSQTPRGINVKIQRKIGNRWVSLVTTKTQAAGRYAGRVKLPAAAGRYRYRAFAPGFEGLKAANSPTVLITVRAR